MKLVEAVSKVIRLFHNPFNLSAAFRRNNRDQSPGSWLPAYFRSSNERFILKPALFICLSLGLAIALTVFISSVHAQTKERKVDNYEYAVLGGGCFWCVEAVFESVRGVEEAVSGYAGGKNAAPTYEQVSQGSTGHAEVVRIKFDPSEIAFTEVLKIFFHTHDPTTLNRQGADVGSQYRSVIYYQNDEQKEQAKQMIEQIARDKLWPDPIVTEVAPLGEFYPAEDYHQNYYQANKEKPYCSLVIGPKIQKLKKDFADRLK